MQSVMMRKMERLETATTAELHTLAQQVRCTLQRSATCRNTLQRSATGPLHVATQRNTRGAQCALARAKMVRSAAARAQPKREYHS
jgi:hypothetical protein